VVHLESKSAPRLMWYGEDLLSVKMPAGTRVMYPNPAIPGLRDREGAIRYALAHPEEMEPLAALLRPGMKVTIAIDDISLPLPKMARPDIRESVLTILHRRLSHHHRDFVSPPHGAFRDSARRGTENLPPVLSPSALQP
jgi:hypothetical protein